MEQLSKDFIGYGLVIFFVGMFLFALTKINKTVWKIEWERIWNLPDNGTSNARSG